MPQCGYRLFVLSLHDGLKREGQPFDKAQARTPEGETKAPDVVDYLDVVSDRFKVFKDKNFNMGLKADDLDDSESDIGTRIGTSSRFQKAEVAGDYVKLWFKSGPVLSDGISADPTNVTDDVDLNGRSTLHDYRAVLRRQAGGKRAILAVETRGNSCPARALVRALKDATDVPWRLKIHERVADKAAVDAFINSGIVEDVELYEWTFDKDGGKKNRRHALSSRAINNKKQAVAKNRIKLWSKSADGSSKTYWKSQAKEISGAFYSAPLNIPFNDVSIRVSNGEVERTFRPSSDFRRFTYVLDKDKLVADSEFFNRADGTALLMIEGVQNPTPVT